MNRPLIGILRLLFVFRLLADDRPKIVLIGGGDIGGIDA